MNPQELNTVLDFEQGCAIGQTVLAKWTNSHRAYAVPATIVKINAKSLVVTINEACGSERYPYPQGHRIHLPRFADLRQWTTRNRAEPIGGYQPVEAVR